MSNVAVLAGWATAVAGIGAWLLALYKVGPERKKLIADANRSGIDATKVITETAMSLLQPSLDQVAFLRTELAVSRQENRELREEVTLLRKEIGLLRQENKHDKIERNAGIVELRQDMEDNYVAKPSDPFTG